MTEQIDQEIVQWLTHCPAGDHSFVRKLKAANSITIRAALKYRGLTLTARKALDARLRALLAQVTRGGRDARGPRKSRRDRRGGSKQAKRC